MKSGLVYSLITAVLFTTYEPISKLIAGSVNPYAVTFWRFMIGALVMLPSVLMITRKEKIKISLKEFAVMGLMGVLLICISMTLHQSGVRIADNPSIIAIVFSSNSIFTIIFATIFIKEKITKRKIAALVLGVAGLLFCADFSSGSNLASVVLSTASAICFSLYTVLCRKYLKNIRGDVQSFIAFVTGSAVLGVILLVFGVDVVPEINVKNVSILCYLGVSCSGIGYISYFQAIKKSGVMMGSLAFFIKPVLTPFVTLIVNGITPSITDFIAVACIVVASYFATGKAKEKEEVV